MTACIVEDTRFRDSRLKKTIHVEGTVTFANAEALRSVFASALQECDYLVVNLQRVREMDASFFMLLCATHRSAEFSKKRMAVKGTIPSAFKRHLENMHHSRIRGCLFSARRHCSFWKYMNN